MYIDCNISGYILYSMEIYDKESVHVNVQQQSMIVVHSEGMPVMRK